MNIAKDFLKAVATEGKHTFITIGMSKPEDIEATKDL